MERILGNRDHKINSLVFKQSICSSTVLGQVKALHLLGRFKIQ